MSDNWSEEWKRSDPGADREQYSRDGVPGDDDDDYDDHDGDLDDYDDHDGDHDNHDNDDDGVPGPHSAHLPAVQPGAEHGTQSQGHLPCVSVRGAPGRAQYSSP